MYPNTTRFIRILAADNAGLDTTSNLKGMDDWVWPDNIELVEQQLKGLTVNEMEAIAKEDGAIAVYRRHAVPDVKEFVDEFFDGALWRNFYNPTPAKD